jgi:ABC-2 type transport system permease protein
MNQAVSKPFHTLAGLATNPVIIKEVRTRMRGWRTFLLVTLHLAGLSLMLGLAYWIFGSALNANTNMDERRIFGKIIFGMLVGMELVMISFTAPALTSGAIASEHERQTYDLLRVTLLSPAALVWGKYLSGLSFILLLLFTALPLLSPAFIIGGIQPHEIFIAILILLVTAITFCAAGIFFSSRTTRTLVATVLSYAFAILLAFGLPMMLLIVIILFGASLSTGNQQISVVTQIMLVYITWFLISLSPSSALIGTEAALLDQQGLWTAHFPVEKGIQVWLISPWLVYVGVALLLSSFLLWTSIRRVRQLEK